MGWLFCPTLPIHLILPQAIHPPIKKKVLKGKCFADVEEAKQKMAEALKSIKIDKFKKCFEQWKKGLNRFLYLVEE